MIIKDETGKRYGRLIVLKKVESKGNRAMYLCKCDCGNEKIICGRNLREGRTMSCGCLRKERARDATITHGMTGTRLHGEWRQMKSRCSIKSSSNYQYYGGRGISICKGWDNDFNRFKDWALSNGYSEELTLDRIDVNGNYEPSNCRWVTLSVQARNRRTRCTSKTGISGVMKRNDRNSYRVTISYDGKEHNVGNFKVLEDAIEARRNAELKYWGFTIINDIEKSV